MKSLISLTSLCVLLVGSPAAMAQAHAQDGTSNTKAPCAAGKTDIVDTAVSAGSFTTLAAALEAAGLVQTLKGDGPFTVFAPTDEAFAKLPDGTLEMLLKPENKESLISILTYHVVPGNVTAEQVVGMTNAATVNGQRLGFMTKGGKVILNGSANIVKTDIACSNGVIHVIDTVVLPVDKSIPAIAAEAGSFSTLLAAVKAGGLDQALEGKGPFTVFAPTDAAFQKLPAGTVENLLKPENKDQLVAILKLHVIPAAVYADQIAKVSETGKTLQGQTLSSRSKDGKTMIGSGPTTATVAAADIQARNGVIHVIDTVLLPK